MFSDAPEGGTNYYCCCAVAHASGGGVCDVCGGDMAQSFLDVGRATNAKMRLPKPISGTTAGQCRQMGIKVGDTIIGRETYSNGHWSEAKLTLLFAGEDEAVWKVMRRSHDKPRWRSTGEQSNWTLEFREWWMVTGVA